ncbi:hypothetical protein SAMN05216566_11753 [Aureimonas phyllosphaerae]|uniref:Uncharacterized protein n=1 Tax=Aureimonas phyllosphaerae TaxID=1166078 RepID=A0A7W6BYR4_9HYPH|nr:hypothetical protein [Aureimonas phyllosphaerae]MBB3961138.1 hypothetical protein [Aureimonas phyllosphaerae]SFF49149.1 hypothetical protein SAMN05216566_11753 [Aureimonas phyllosphaerae]
MSIRREFLEYTLAVLNDYLDIEDYEEVKTVLEKELR